MNGDPGIAELDLTRALYTDWKNVYKGNPARAEQLRGVVPADAVRRS